MRLKRCCICHRQYSRLGTFERFLLESPSFYRLLEYTDVPTFEVASDAFLTFKELLSRHSQLTARFLLAHSDTFFAEFNGKLLSSTNYVTRRQSLKARCKTKALWMRAHLSPRPSCSASSCLLLGMLR